MRNSFSVDCPGLAVLPSFLIEGTTKDATDCLFLKGILLWKRNTEMIAISKSHQHARVSSHINEHTDSKPFIHILICQFYKNCGGSRAC